MEAACNGHLEVVKQLLEAGANKDKQTKVRPRGLRARSGRAGRETAFVRCAFLRAFACG